MSELEVYSLLQKMAAMRDGGDWPAGAELELQELYTVLEKVQRKVAHAVPLVDSRSSAAYSTFLAGLRRVSFTVDDALDSYSASARRFPFRHKIRHTLTTMLSPLMVVPSPPLIVVPMMGVTFKIPILVRKIGSPRSSPLQPEQPSAPPLKLRPKIARRFEDAVKDVRMLLRLFSTYVADLLPPPEHQQPEPGLGADPDETWSLPDQEAVRGREQDIYKIRQILEHPGTKVVAIVGMAGVGKTELTRHLLYDKSSATTHGFNYSLWVPLSQDFNPEWIYRQVISKLSVQLKAGEDAESFWWSLNSDLNEGLINKKHLLVLDGVWNEDPRKWKELMDLLYGNCTQKTKIIVTTRIPAAAAAISSAVIYHLHPFSVEHTLEMLQTINGELPEKLLGGGSSNATVSTAAAKELSKRKVAERCSGLPTIIKFLSSSLESICANEVADPLKQFDMMCAGNQGLLHIAEASYNHLPPHLKRCFLYCSLFPYHHIFDTDEMISLMVAEGLTQTTSREAQVDGDISRLLSECFDLVNNPGSNGGNRRGCMMHRVLHILARHKGQELYKAIVGDHSAALKEHSNIRYMSLTVDHTTTELPGSLTAHTDLRTLILLRTQKMVLSGQKSEIKEIPSDYCRYLTYLRVLDLQATKINKLPEKVEMPSNLRYLNLSQTDIDKLPESIGRLQYLVSLNISQTCIATVPDYIGKIHSLRYLNLSQTDIGKLPDSICSLRLLQTLQLSRCEKLTKLPQNIGSVTSLQRLDLEGCYYLSEMPQDISNLKNVKELNVLECPSLDKMPCGLSALTKIEALPRYIATSGDNNPILELRDLVKLKRLGLENIANISNEDAEKIQLQKKHELEHLTLNCNMDAENRKSSSEVKELLDCLEPNPGLKILEIISYAGETFPCWMANTNPQLKKLTQIRIIRLINLKCSSLPPLGQLHQLETLEISGMNAIKNVSSELHGELNADTFRSLKKIVFSHMVNLQCWPVENGAICEHLKELSIIQCPKFHKLSMNLNIEKLTLLMSPHELLGREGLAGVARSLKSLSISLCEELSASSNCEGLTMLSNLEELKISGCDELENLPPGMENLTALKRLSVIGCQKFQNLTDLLECTALSSLVISDCPMLPSVPQGLRGITTCE